MSSFFVELSIVMIIALAMSFIFHKLKQPLLVGYIFTGVLAGPIFFNVLSNVEGYEAFSHMGVALLLFIVGLHLNLKLIREIGFVALVSGMFQIVLTALFGFLISWMFGIGLLASFLIGVGLAFSSTIVIVKLLSDLREIERVHGKLSMGILIVQDLVAVVMLMLLASFAGAENGNLLWNLFKIFVLGMFAIVAVLVFSKYVLEKLLDRIADSQEFLFTFVIAWCLGVAALFAYMGFSVEVGALLAGVALASSPYQYEISSRVKPLRDFFIIMFFILLGSQMIPVSEIPNVVSYTQGGFFSTIGIFANNFNAKMSYLFDSFSQIFLPALVMSIFILILKPFIVYVILNGLGFHSKVSFRTGLSLAQISEFSLIMILIAKGLGLVSANEVSLLTLVMIITILVSTYFIMHSSSIYVRSEKILAKFDFKKKVVKSDKEEDVRHDLDVMIFGYDRIGFSLLKTIDKLGKKYVVIDFNPEVIKKLDVKKVSCVYGDASDNEFVNEFNLDRIEMFISTIPDVEVSMSLLKQIKKRNKSGTVILTANQIDNALELYKAGADYVILPHFLGGDFISTLIEKYDKNLDQFLHEKIRHIGELKERRSNGFDHPLHIK